MLSLLRDNCLGKEERILIIPEDLEHLKAKTVLFTLVYKTTTWYDTEYIVNNVNTWWLLAIKNF